MNKFEKLIEYIINDDTQKARELFHSIVVEKSRDIYESIMDEESMEETVQGNKVEAMVDEITDDEAAMEDDDTFALDSEGPEGEPAGELPADDAFGGEPEGGFGDEPELGGAEGGHDDVVLDIDAKLDELLAKFDNIMGGSEGPAEEPAAEPAFGGTSGKSGKSGSGAAASGEGEEEAESMYEGENPFAKSGKSGKSGSAVSGKSGKSGSAVSGKSGKSGKSAAELMREYVETVGQIYGGQGDATEGDAVGAAGKKTSVNTKQVSLTSGPDFGGTSSNIVGKKGATNENPDGKPVPKANNEYTKGQGEIKSGNVNVPGGNAGKSGFKTKEGEYSTEHGKEGQTTDGSVPVAKKSVQKQNTGVKK